MVSFKEMLNEIKLTPRTDFNTMADVYPLTMKKLYNTIKRYKRMYTFDVSGHSYYCVIFSKDSAMEPHFGRYNREKLNTLESAILNNDVKIINKLIQDPEVANKDGFLDKDINLIQILSYVFSILKKEIDYSPPTFIRIMGQPRKYDIYSKFVKANISFLPYNIIKENEPAEYVDGSGTSFEAKSLLLKYKLA